MAPPPDVKQQQADQPQTQSQEVAGDDVLNESPSFLQDALVDMGAVEQQVDSTLQNGLTIDPATMTTPDQPSEEAEEKPKDTVTEDDKAEYAALKSMSYNSFANVEAYVKFRDDHFGGSAAYASVKAQADKEWKENKTIQRMVGQRSDSDECRRVLYRWLRLEYQKKGYDTTEKILALMKQGMSPAMRTAVNAVKKDHPDLKPGGFVPRPKKKDGKYRLGTLSEHGTGDAIDVDARNNPQMSEAAWTEIETITGKTVDRSRSRWKEDPAALWKDVHDLNEAYVKEVAKRVEAEKKKRRDAKKPEDKPSPYNTVLSNKALRARARAGKVSFFSLEKDVVVAMGKQGLIWGVTFRSTPDLHHFEL